MTLENNFQRSINLELDLDSSILDEYKLTENSANVILAFLHNLRSEENERSVLFSGSYGIGKSYLFLCLANFLRFNKDNFKAKYPNLFAQLKEHNNLFKIKNDIKSDFEIVLLQGDAENIIDYFFSKLKINYQKNDNNNYIKVLTDYFNEKLKENKHILMIYDEFGQFLESQSKNEKNPNFKLLQDIAEVVNKSKNANLILITHKKLDNYTSNLSNDYKNEWRKVSGRFLTKHYTMNLTVLLELMLKKLNSNDLSKQRSMFYDNGITKPSERLLWKTGIGSITGLKPIEFLIKDQNINSIWPLHPISFLSLPILSSEVGQNERSMISFFNSIQSFGLMDWLNSFLSSETTSYIDSDVILLYQLWDFFEDVIREDIGFGGKAEIWKKVNKIISIIKHESDHVELINLIKTIAVLEITSDYSGLYPSKEIILYSYSNIGNHDYKEKLEILINRLEEYRVIVYHKTRKRYELYEGSPVNWEQEIENVIAKTVINNRKKLTILRNYTSPPVFYPRKYNNENFIKRFFYPIILDSFNEISSESRIEELIKRNFNADGLILYFPMVKWSENLAIKFKELNLEKYKAQLIFVFSNKDFYLSPIPRLVALNELNNNKEFKDQDNRIQGELELEIRFCKKRSEQ
jgi:hypothetical protein